MEIQALRQLFSEMSLKEKIGQLVQLPAAFENEGMATGPAAEMGLTQEDVQLAGSYLSIIGAEKLKKLQTGYMRRHPHHIPLLFMGDIINGYRTVFPIPLAQGCTFDPETVEDCAAVAAREASASGLHVTFSPMADLVRDARWGRVMESTGEDPYLNGRMAAAMVRGYQGKALTDKGSIASCLKHFAGYGAPEGGRDYNTVELSSRTLREDYLPAYRSAVDAGCELVMPSFNTLDRVPSAASEWLLRDVLRGEMGFDGAVISDWNAVQELLNHGIAANEQEAALLALRAGVDIDMASPIYAKHLKELVESGKIPELWVDDACWHVLMLKNKLGLFEHPFKDGSEADEEALLLCDEHRRKARACAEKSFVLLKNEENMLPLLREETSSAAFIGPYVGQKQICGSWSIFADDGDSVSLKAALAENEYTKNAPTAPGCPVWDGPVPGFREPEKEPELDLDQALSEAVALAKKAKNVVLCLGEHRECTGEAASRGDLTLPECQLRLLDAVAQANENVIVVLFSGRPLDIRRLQEKAKAILLAWLPGTEGGHALVRTLLGESNPSGRLSMCFPWCVGQLPIHYDHLNTGRPFHGDFRKARFASKYLDIPNEPLYPFGWGLSYTAFAYSPVTLDAPTMGKFGAVRASVRVTNTGRRRGTETVQLYIRDLAASVARPVRQLKGFAQVTLAPGESREVCFEITEEMLRFYDIRMNYLSEPGEFDVFIGPDSRTENKARFTLTE